MPCGFCLENLKSFLLNTTEIIRRAKQTLPSSLPIQPFTSLLLGSSWERWARKRVEPPSLARKARRSWDSDS